MGAAIVAVAVLIAWQQSSVPAVALAAGVGAAYAVLLAGAIRQWRAIMKTRDRRFSDWLNTQTDRGEALQEDDVPGAERLEPVGGAETRRCIECGRYNPPDSDRCSWCLGQSMSARMTRPSRAWDPDTRSGKVLLHVVMLVAWGSALTALGGLAGVGGIEAAAYTSGPSNIPLALRTAAVAYVAGTLGLIVLAGLWRQFSTAFGRGEDLAQMLAIGLLAFSATVSAGWLMLLDIA